MRHLLVALAALATACAAPYFSGQTGRVTPRGAIRASAATGYSFASSAADAVNDAKALAGGVARVACPTESDPGRRCFRREDLAPVVDAGLRLAIAAPFASHSELAVRYGLAPRVDAGLRLSPELLRLDAGVQLLGPLDPAIPGASVSLLGGVARRDTGPVGDVLALLRGEASIVDLDVALVAGRQLRDVAHAYAGVRWMVSRWSLRLGTDLPVVGDDGTVAGLSGTDTRGDLHHAGVLVGGALGWRRVYLGAELSAAWYRGEARVLGRERLVEGLAVMPSVFVFATY